MIREDCSIDLLCYLNAMPSLIRKIEPGDVVGRCRIVRELGRGGVGTVYLASHQTLQIEVALKILSPSLSLENPALAERFIREAQLAARIRHPHVIAVMDAAHDEATGLNFIVMEYVGGGSLSWHLRNGPMPEVKALTFIAHIAQALVVAEESGIVHRDIKPDNIMLDRRGLAKLADLGLAKHAIDAHTSLTLGGSFMGTPAYMSPDQARDAKVADTRDDIYSLGATFYECLTGEPPFRGDTPYNIMSELLTKPSPQPRAIRPEISQASDLICRKMMAKTRGLRYATARALADDLQLALAEGDAALDRLEAANFEGDALSARRQARDLGVSQEAGDAVPRPPDVRPLRRERPGLVPVRPVDRGLWRTAFLLLALVTFATGALLIISHRPETHRFKARLLQAWEGFVTPTSVFVAKTSTPKQEPAPAPTAKPVENPAPAPVAETPTYPVAVPVALPVTGPLDTNGMPLAPNAPAPPDSAFAARATAESTLTDLVSPTGQVPVLRIIGKREAGAPAPMTWTFYFYDPKAFSNARIISVNGRRVVKNGVDIWHPLDPFHEEDIIPDDKLLTDSDQALQIAQQLIPGVAVSSSQFELVEKDSVPMWKITLWARDADGGEEELGGVTILAEKGVVSSNTLKPERVTGQ
jgi:hypothetical protein